jgi:hypothetical protein
VEIAGEADASGEFKLSFAVAQVAQVDGDNLHVEYLEVCGQLG